MSEPRYYTAPNLVIDRERGTVVAEFKYQCRRACAINAAKYAAELNAKESPIDE